MNVPSENSEWDPDITAAHRNLECLYVADSVPIHFCYDIMYRTRVL